MNPDPEIIPFLTGKDRLVENINLSTPDYSDAKVKTLSEVTGIDCIKTPMCLQEIWNEGSIWSEETCLYDIWLLALYFNSLPMGIKDAIGNINAWREGTPNVCALGNALVDAKIIEAYEGRTEFSCRIACKSATIKQEHYCDPANCEYDSEVIKQAEDIKKATSGLMPGVKDDVGHADDLLQVFKGKFRWAKHLSSWMAWTGNVWEEAQTESVAKVASNALLDIYLKEWDRSETRDKEEWIKEIRQARNLSRLNAALILLRGMAGIRTESGEWDRDAYKLNTEGAVIDLRTFEARMPDPDDLMTKLAPVRYDQLAKGTRFIEHLQKVIPDENVRRHIQRHLGRSLIGEVTAEELNLWVGGGGNGKTTTYRIIMKVLGTYAKKAAPNLLIARSHEAHPTEIADLQGARLVFSAEVDEGKKLAEAVMKEQTGGDVKKARKMRQDFYEFNQTYDLVLIANYTPKITGQDRGLWRRIKLTPWNTEIPEAEKLPQDAFIASQMEEASEVLNWLLAGLKDWQNAPKWVAKEVLAATAEYKDEQNALLEFIGEECNEVKSATVELKQLFARYQAYCDEMHEIAISKRSMLTVLKSMDYKTDDKGSKHSTRIHGLSLRTLEERDEETKAEASTKLIDQWNESNTGKSATGTS